MSQSFDAIIIGAGIIGASIAFELSKRGYRALNLDKLSAAGAGSMANTCAIIRTHYWTEEGTVLAYENYLHWKNRRNDEAHRHAPESEEQAISDADFLEFQGFWHKPAKEDLGNFGVGPL